MKSSGQNTKLILKSTTRKNHTAVGLKKSVETNIAKPGKMLQVTDAGAMDNNADTSLKNSDNKENCYSPDLYFVFREFEESFQLDTQTERILQQQMAAEMANKQGIGKRECLGNSAQKTFIDAKSARHSETDAKEKLTAQKVCINNNDVAGKTDLVYTVLADSRKIMLPQKTDEATNHLARTSFSVMDSQLDIFLQDFQTPELAEEEAPTVLPNRSSVLCNEHAPSDDGKGPDLNSSDSLLFDESFSHIGGPQFAHTSEPLSPGAPPVQQVVPPPFRRTSASEVSGRQNGESSKTVPRASINQERVEGCNEDSMILSDMDSLLASEGSHDAAEPPFHADVSSLKGVNEVANVRPDSMEKGAEEDRPKDCTEKHTDRPGMCSSLSDLSPGMKEVLDGWPSPSGDKPKMDPRKNMREESSKNDSVISFSSNTCELIFCREFGSSCLTPRPNDQNKNCAATLTDRNERPTSSTNGNKMASSVNVLNPTSPCVELPFGMQTSNVRPLNSLPSLQFPQDNRAASHPKAEIVPQNTGNGEQVENPTEEENSIIMEGFSLQLSQDGLVPSCSAENFSIIDVANDKALFHTFVQEWKTKDRFAISVACEKTKGCLDHRSVIGANFKRSSSTLQNIQHKDDGFRISASEEILVVGLAVCWGGKDAYYISLQQKSEEETEISASLAPPPLDQNLTVAERLKHLQLCLQDCQRTFSLAAYDFIQHYKTLLKACGISLAGCFEDPKVASWLLDPGSKERCLHNMVANFLPQDLFLLDKIGAGQMHQSLGLNAAADHSGRYRAAVESVLVFLLMDQLNILLQKDNLQDVFNKVEMPNQYCLALLELNGIGFSTVECETQKHVMEAKLNEIESRIYQLAGHSFSLTSPDDLAEVLFLEQKLPPDGDLKVQRCKKTLEKLKLLHPLPGLILEWRKISNAITKVVFPLQREKILNTALGMERIYPVSQTHSATGRISFREPNIQNVPKDFEIEMPTLVEESPPSQRQHDKFSVPGSRARKRSVLIRDPSGMAEKIFNGKRIPFSVSMRHAFVPFPGGLILAADYSQLELRILAHLCRDGRLLQALNEGTDVFRSIAAEWKMIDPEAVGGDLRQQAKQICYGMIYGIGPKSLGEQMGVEEKDASYYIKTFKSRYPGIQKFLRDTVKKCSRDGFVQTITGRRRYLPTIKDSNPYKKAQAERQAVNTVVQGSAADIVKTATVNIQKQLEALPSAVKSFEHFNSSLFQEKWAGKPERAGKRQMIHPRHGGFFILQLHDELLYEVAEDSMIQVAQIVKHEMENAIKLSVKLTVKVKVGPSWGDLQELKL
ncbi:hypothetical protein JRQ81_004177 [Phrynocephalus forsythii]|uniref:DNA-directed DNA polymerase n=1 Tax=Phrynocephalus forsythii TaxID=171643 RepID=A0A9Q1AY54_9SAUR|nr:hypothetical protein JRQ81_004177 [Phrynocephalus forsythii]